MPVNDEYSQAIQHTGSPMLVIAGPGSGKTKTMIDKIAYLVKDIGVKPENILALTFSDKAAEELKEEFAPKGGFKECEWCDYEELCEGEQ